MAKHRQGLQDTMGLKQLWAMMVIEIHEPVHARMASEPDQTILVAPGSYEGERWIHPNMEQETVRIISNGQILTFMRESRLARRAVSTLGGEPFESQGPITFAEFLDQARVFFGDDDFNTIRFYAKFS